MENSSFEKNDSLEVPNGQAEVKPHPELTDANNAVAGFGDYLARVLQQEIYALKSKGGPSASLTDKPVVQDRSDEAISDCHSVGPSCSSNGCEILDFHPRRPERPTDDSWGSDPPRNPPPKRFTEDYPRFGPFPWDYL
jgi:hypothetical protein